MWTIEWTTEAWVFCDGDVSALMCILYQGSIQQCDRGELAAFHCRLFSFTPPPPNASSLSLPLEWVIGCIPKSRVCRWVRRGWLEGTETQNVVTRNKRFGLIATTLDPRITLRILTACALITWSSTYGNLERVQKVKCLFRQNLSEKLQLV